MAVVRFAVLVALVVWIAGLLGTVAGVRSHALWPWLAYAAGGVIVVGLFAMKFVGPPPHSFVARAAIAVLMIALTFIDHIYRVPAAPMITLALGFVMLAWYVRE